MPATLCYGLPAAWVQGSSNPPKESLRALLDCTTWDLAAAAGLLRLPADHVAALGTDARILTCADGQQLGNTHSTPHSTLRIAVQSADLRLVESDQKLNLDPAGNLSQNEQLVHPSAK